MAAANVVSTLNGLFKEVYADDLEVVLPKGLKVQNDIKFAPRAQMPGNQFHQPVLLQHEHGFTYAAAGSGVFTLNASVAGKTEDATIVGTQMMLRAQIGIEAAARAVKGPRAFKRVIDVVVENMTASARKRMEIDYFYGQKGIGNCTGATIATGANGTITFTKAEWAPGIWAGQEDAICEIFDSAMTTQRGGDHTITEINMSLRRVKFDSVNAGVTDGDVVFFKSQRTTSAHNVFAGLHALLDSPTTLHGITVANYSLWSPNSVAIGGALTFAGVNGAIPDAVGKGLDEDLSLYISPEVWADLLDDEVAQRRWINSPKTGSYDVGAEGLQFYSQNGTTTIKPSIYCKNGLGFAIPTAHYRRIGATDLTYKLPDRGDEMFRHLESSAGYELRSYVNHSLFTRCPAYSILLTGITT